MAPKHVHDIENDFDFQVGPANMQNTISSAYLVIIIEIKAT